MRINGDVAYQLLVILSIGFYTLYFALHNQLQLHFESPSVSEIEKFTIRVNTFRRNDLLTAFLGHYTTCAKVELIQVVWSDQVNKPPSALSDQYSSKVMFETHPTDRLSNRFRALSPLPTRAVLSIDDDLLIPCEQLHQGLEVWTANERALVGFSPRMHGTDPVTGQDRYLRWQNTWWAGVYSISLTKASFLHRDYLASFFSVLPERTIASIDQHRNCEDLAMAYVVGKEAGVPPVWVRGVVHETADFGISTGASHFEDRSRCLTSLRLLQGNSSVLPLVSAYQKAIPLSPAWDWLRLARGGGK